MSTRRINVVHVCDKFGVKGSSTHGVSRMFMWIFPRFDRTRFNVRLVGLRPADHASEHIEQQGIPVQSLGRGKFDLSTVLDLRRIIRNEQTDVLHLHGYGACTFGRMAAAGTKAKCVIHEHFVDPAMPKVQVPFDYVLAGRCDRGIAASKSVKEFMVRERFVPAEKIDVLYYGTSLKDFRPLPPEQGVAERKKWNVPDGDKVIGFVGRLDTQKGLVFLIDAAAELMSKGQRITVMLVGDGPMMEALESRCREKGISGRVIFTRHCSDVRSVMSVFDVQVFSSLWEGSPLALFEAMAMGRPLVSTNVDGLGEVLRDRETALLVPPRDASGLAAAIEKLVHEPETAARLASEAQRESARFDVQRTVDSMQEIYSSLAD